MEDTQPATASPTPQPFTHTPRIGKHVGDQVFFGSLNGSIAVEIDVWRKPGNPFAAFMVSTTRPLAGTLTFAYLDIDQLEDLARALIDAAHDLRIHQGRRACPNCDGSGRMRKPYARFTGPQAYEPCPQCSGNPAGSQEQAGG